MSHDLTETASMPSPVTVPDNGDSANATPLIAAVQTLANRSRLYHDWLHSRFVLLNAINELPSSYTTSSTSFVSVSSGTTFSDVQSGDYLLIDVTASVQIPSGATATLHIRVNQTGGDSGPQVACNIAGIMPFSLTYAFPVGSGSVNVSLQVKTTSGSVTVSNACVRIVQMRALVV